MLGELRKFSETSAAPQPWDDYPLKMDVDPFFFLFFT